VNLIKDKKLKQVVVCYRNHQG